MPNVIPCFREYLAWRCASRTVTAYGAIAASFFEFVGTERFDQVGRDELERFLGRPTREGGRRAPATYNQELAALRALGKLGIRRLGWSENPAEGIPFAREAPRDPPVLNLGEIRTLFEVAAAVSPQRYRSRNLAMLAVLVQLGLRVHELVALKVGQVDVVSATLVGIHGKGGTVHDLPLNATLLSLLGAWLEDRRAMTTGDECALFVSDDCRRVSIRSVQRLVVKVRDAMGTAKRVTPHTLRHSCATLALTLGADLSTVSDLLRHSDLNTTRRYLHLVDERRRDAVAKLQIAVPPGVLPVADTAFQVPPNTQACESNGQETCSTPLGSTLKSVHDEPVSGREKPLDAQHGLNVGKMAA